MPLTGLTAEVQTQLNIAFKNLRITATANCQAIHLSGTVHSYYHKQLAQHLAMMCLQNRAQIVNDINVVPKEGIEQQPTNTDQ